MGRELSVNTSARIAVAIVDDDPLVRSAVSSFLATDPDIDVVAQGADGREAVSIVASHHVDVLLMDVNMPHLDGVAATAEVRRESPHTRVLLLTALDTDNTVRAGISAGASGYLLKDSSVQAIVEGVRSVHRGNVVMSQIPANRLLTPPATPVKRPELPLSSREVEVLELLCQGLSNDEIASAMMLSESTIKTHVSAVISKLGVSSRLKAVARAHQLGIVRGV